MIKAFLLAVLFFSEFVVEAQQVPMMGQVSQINRFLNPALSGNSGDLRLSIHHRNPWVSYYNLPRTTRIAIDAPVPGTPFGSGALLSFAKTGYHHIRKIHLNGAYGFDTELGRLSFGIGAGVQNRAIEQEWFIEQSLDAFIIEAYSRTNHFDANLGVHFQSKFFFVSSAIQQLIESTWVEDFENGKLIRHFLHQIGTRIWFSKSSALYCTAAISQASLLSTSFDLEFTYVVAQIVWARYCYRHDKAHCYSGGIDFGKLIEGPFKSASLSYQYEDTFNGTAIYSSGTHDIMLSFRMNMEDKTERESFFRTGK